MDGLLRDVRHAVRMLAGAPSFALPAILTLALSIGANIAMFSVVYGVLLRPLPYQEAERLGVVRAEVDLAGANRPVPISIQSSELAAWNRAFDSIAAVAFYTSSDVVAMSGDNGSEVLDAAVVSSTFFSTMAGPFASGRPLGAADDTAPAAVISERLARRLFGAAERAVGEQLQLSRQLYSIVGVVDDAFQFPGANVDVWRPAGFVRAVNPRCCSFQAVLRLDPAGTLERARDAVRPLFERSTAGQGRPNHGVRTSVVRLSDQIVSAVRPALLMLFASVSMVLIIACGNLVNLLLARNAAREQEFAVRRALGASAGGLVRQLLVESAALASAGTVCGALLARIGLALLARFAGDAIPRIDAIHIDRLAMLFAAGLATLATVLTGITPALRAVRGTTIPSQDPTRTATAGGVRRLQQAMCVLQVALAVMLLVGATLMGRSLVRLVQVDLGVATDHVLTSSVTLAFGERPPDAQTIARIDRVIDRVGSLPGVRAVGAGTSLPPNASRLRVTLRRSGDAVDYQATAVPATPGYSRPCGSGSSRAASSTKRTTSATRRC